MQGFDYFIIDPSTTVFVAAFDASGKVKKRFAIGPLSIEVESLVSFLTPIDAGDDTPRDRVPVDSLDRDDLELLAGNCYRILEVEESGLCPHMLHML